MSDICRDIITHPAAWTPESIGGKAGFARRLDDAQLTAIEALIAKTRDRPPQAVDRAAFDHPAINRLADEIRAEVMDGKGAVVVQGIAPDRFSVEDMERAFWGLGTHLGVAAVQSRSGDRLGRVEYDENDPVARGYRSQSELTMHTDSYEIVGLNCVQKAAVGGYSAIVSALSIHNEMLRTRPELLAPLYEGFYMAIPEARDTKQPLTEVKIPVFCDVGGRVSCMYAGSFYRGAAERLGAPLPDGLSDALDLFYELANSDRLACRFMLEPGEMMLWHNFTVLHSRTEFQNDADHKRLLLRLWLDVPGGRAVVPEFYARANTYKRVYEELSQTTGA